VTDDGTFVPRCNTRSFDFFLESPIKAVIFAAARAIRLRWTWPNCGVMAAPQFTRGICALADGVLLVCQFNVSITISRPGLPHHQVDQEQFNE
jgi:hypothetical protein